MSKNRLASRVVTSAAALATLGVSAWPPPAHAQTANSYITPQTPLLKTSLITSSAVATFLDCSTNPCINGAIIEAILTVGSSVSHTISIFTCTAACPSTAHLLMALTLPANSGVNGGTPVNLLSASFIGAGLPRNNNGNFYIHVPAGTFLTAMDTTPASASNPLQLAVIGGAY